MNNSRLVELDRLLNEARLAADEVAGTLENLADLYATQAAHKPDGSAAQEKRLAATFSTIQARAAYVVELLDKSLG